MIKPSLKKIILSLLSLLFIIQLGSVNAQESKMVLTLDEVIAIAQRQSPAALSAAHRFRSSYWYYSNYKATLMPKLTLNATIPSLSKAIEQVTTTEGDVFYRSNQASYAGALSLSKNIGLTGGQIFLDSRLNRIDHFRTDSTFTFYHSSPLIIGIDQPLFGYNKFKWLKKTEPLKYSEAERMYIEDMEQVSKSAARAFFSLLQAQIKLKIEQTNLANNDTLFQIAKGRYNIGTLAENELLQIELSHLTSKAKYEDANIQLKSNAFELKSFLRLPEDVEVELIPPAAPPVSFIEEQIALKEAHKNRAEVLGYDRRIIEAESEVSAAKANRRFSARLRAEYGLAQSTRAFEQLYRNPYESQSLEIGIIVPILDWGTSKSAIKLAESQRELTRTAVQQEIVDFDQEIYFKVMQYNLQKSQFAIASKSDTVAQKRYEVTKQRYLIGKIGITELNIAQNEKDAARLSYVSILSDYWDSYFELRRLTHFDFLKKEQILFDINSIPDLE